MGKRLQDILDECLERVVTGEESLEACLARYPDQAADLEPLLRVALRAKGLSQLQPRPEFKAQVRYQWLSTPTQPQKRRVPFLGWVGRWAGMAAVIVLLFLLGGGTVIASANSLPGEKLYPVKAALERVRLFLARSDAARTDFRLNLAQRRLDEVVRMVTHRPGVILKALEAMGKETDNIAERLPQLGDKRELAQKLADLTLRQEQVISGMMEKAPPEVRPALEKALDRAQRGHQKALEILGKGPSGPMMPTPSR